MKFKRIILLLLILFCCDKIKVVGAEKTLSLTDCFQAALKRSEILADQQEQLLQAEEHYQQAVAYIMPSVSGQASYLRQDSGNSPGTEQQYSKISVIQPLFRGFREYAAIYQSWNLITAQREAKLWASMQLYQDVSQAFYNVVVAKKDIEHLDAQIELYSHRIGDLQARVAIGRSRNTEVLSVQAAQALLKAQRQQIMGQLNVLREILAFITGLDSLIVLTPTADDLPQLSALDDYLVLINSRPDILAAQQKLEFFRKSIDIAKGGHWPSLDANGNYYLTRSAPNQDMHWDASLVLTLPIFMGGAINSKTREAESQFRQSELVLNRLRRQAAMDLRSQYQTLQSDLEQLKILEEAVEISRKNNQAVLRDYNLSLVTNLDVLQATSSYQDTLRSVDRMRYTVQNDFEHLEALAAKRVNLVEGK